jgi:hypothetical protein
MGADLVPFTGQSEDYRDADIAALKEQITRLRDELREAKADAATARREAAHALAALRKQLSPLYRALQAVFGELDAVGVDETPGASAPASNARVAAIWESWKGRLGPTCAKVIDALLLQPDMTNRQIAMAIGTGRIQTVYEAVTKMNKASLLTKNGDRYSLKQL